MALPPSEILVRFNIRMSIRCRRMRVVTFVMICLTVYCSACARDFFGGSSTKYGLSNEICDFYAVDCVADTLVCSPKYGCTRYIECEGAETVKLSAVKDSTLNLGVVFYDKEKHPIGFRDFFSCSLTDGGMVTLDVPQNATFFRTSYYNSSNQQKKGEFHYVLEGMLPQGYRPFHEEPIYFSVSVEQKLGAYQDGFVGKSEKKATTGVLLLPPNYDPQGKPVPIIMYCHGYSHYVYYDHWGSTGNFLKQKYNWTTRGYAVFDCNGARNDNRREHFTSVGSPQFVEAMALCYEYIKEHYNVEHQVYVVGGSAGGPLALNYARFKDDVKAVALLSPWVDIYKCAWGQNVRSNFVKYLEFKNTSNYDEDKVYKYNPVLHPEELKAPLRCWVSSREKGGLIYNNAYHYVNLLKELSKDADITEVAKLGHSQLVSGATPEIDFGVVDWFDANR